MDLAIQQAMFQASPQTACGAFRAQGQGIAVPVLEGVHFFFDNIGDFTDRTLEQFGLFDDR